ncbi:AMP-binding protein [bacterium AH-315-E10]|nr:AMP-binding protein [bacterium AH-315-E10]
MKVICFGDSLTSCGHENGRYSDILQDRFPQHDIINKGAGGDTFEDARLRLKGDVLDLEPDVVLIEFGANDWWKDERPLEEWAKDLEYFISKIMDMGAQAMVLGVFDEYLDESGNRVEKTYGIDARARAYRDLEREVAEKHNCPYIGNIQESIINRRCCWLDNNHPNELGNRFIADRLEDILIPVLGNPLPIRSSTLSTTRDMWIEAVEYRPKNTAVIEGGRSLTYAEADKQVQALATGIAGVSGERPKVAVYLPNSIDYFIVYWAVVRLGGAIVPINTWLKQDSLDGIFQTVQPDMLIVTDSSDKLVVDVAKHYIPDKIYALKEDDLPSLSTLFVSGAAPYPDLKGEDISIIMHTSGTTALPKGAIMRHVDLMFNVMTTINAHQFCPSDVHLVINPMFHCTALYSSLPTAAYQKSVCVISSESNAEGILRLIEKHKITTLLSIPTIFQRLVSIDSSEIDSSSLRILAYAGSAMPVSTIRLLHTHFPDVELHNFFGLTETISMTHVLTGDDAEERPDSIGRLLPFVDAVIVNEHDEMKPANTIGRLLFARDGIINDYYNQPGKLDNAIISIDGMEWFDTGDLALIDDEGYFFIKGRVKDMIIVGGENVYASEVESILMSHDSVKEAVIKGIPATGIRESLGEMIRAYIVLRDGSETAERDIRKHCHEKLASYKIPHEYMFMDVLPRNPSGKVIKDDLPN